MKVTIHQPNYLPYLGFFNKINKSDIFVSLDTVQFVKSGPLAWMNRNKIRTAEGWAWLTVPVLTRGKFPVSMQKALIDNGIDWKKKHFSSLYYSYKRAKYFDKYIGFFEELYKKEWQSLNLLNEEIIKYLLAELAISVKIVRASDLNTKAKGTELLVAICKQVGANQYIYGKHGADYMEFNRFKENGIKLIADNFISPCYNQLYKPFIENLSIVDLLFNEGENSLKILQGVERVSNDI